MTNYFGNNQMESFDEFVGILSVGAKELAKKHIHGFEDEALESVKSFAESSKNDILRWTRLVSQGLITEQDFRDFLRANKALAQISALKQKGVSLAKLQQFRSGLLNLVTDNVLGYLA